MLNASFLKQRKRDLVQGRYNGVNFYEFTHRTNDSLPIGLGRSVDQLQTWLERVQNTTLSHLRQISWVHMLCGGV